jgi:hypothetical protein
LLASLLLLLLGHLLLWERLWGSLLLVLLLRRLCLLTLLRLLLALLLLSLLLLLLLLQLDSRPLLALYCPGLNHEADIWLWIDYGHPMLRLQCLELSSLGHACHWQWGDEAPGKSSLHRRRNWSLGSLERNPSRRAILRGHGKLAREVETSSAVDGICRSDLGCILG